MVTVLLRRFGGLVLTLVISSFVIFAGMYAAPGDPVTFLIGNPENLTPDRIAAVRAEYHLDQPFLAQYALWATGVLRGDLGTSMFYQQPVSDLLSSRLPMTLTLVAMASVLFILIGVGLGVLSALRRGTVVDSAVTGFTTFINSVPNFVIGLVLVAIFAVQLRWFPVAGDGEGFADRLYHLTLPAISLALGSIALISRVTRQTMVEQQSLDHVEAARSYGLSTRQIVLRHVLRNSLGPVVTMCGLVVAGMLAGTVVIESVFGLNGLGGLLVEAINTHDFPVVQAILLYMVIGYMVVTILVDLAYPLLDPRSLARSDRS
ncbi:ABC transporter permease [Kibdelosporangium aridum]|uniref:Peptide/nickel transport system permease protein n=1 Tax=Kibdelosporangium aridum TaxID=2030 RepID=A0A1W2FCR4_KIBAR|nr:ABC transporter permease [Kibdelosporangium aridum]SMD19366.1 peptide/nickel transport system permease protein [Kibdelosporangium aridum]